ncbi:MAG: gliding motility-associated protein GldE [Bacteroidetes bacterium]|nr:gliding motility-associated protein GldE [Bacteroidota bacterium]
MLLLVGIILKQFTFGVAVGLLSILFLLICSALISGSEIAFFSLDPQQLKQLRNLKSKKNQIILSLIEKPKKLLATVLIANNFVNVAIVIISTFVTTELVDFSNHLVLGFVFQVIIVTGLILLIGEIMPKVYATRNAIKFASFMALPLVFLIKLFYPLSYILVHSSSLIDKRIAKRGHNISMNELSHALEITEISSNDESDQKILKSIVNFGDIDVKEIMKSRLDITTIDIETKFDELLKIILDSGYSRIPVFQEQLDKIVGVLYIKDLLKYLDKDSDFKWQSLIRTPFFVPESKKINDLFKEFQEKKIHLAIVVDEYGGTSGLVTLEDILEEILGEINDEFDSEDIPYSKINENTYVFEGKTSLNDFCKITGVDFDFFDEVKGEFDSIAGLILELVGKIPQKCEIVSFKNFNFEIEAVDKKRINRIKITINEETK